MEVLADVMVIMVIITVNVIKLIFGKVARHKWAKNQAADHRLVATTLCFILRN